MATWSPSFSASKQNTCDISLSDNLLTQSILLFTTNIGKCLSFGGKWFKTLKNSILDSVTCVYLPSTTYIKAKQSFEYIPHWHHRRSNLSYTNLSLLLPIIFSFCLNGESQSRPQRLTGFVLILPRLYL